MLDGDLEVNAEGGGDTGAPQVKDNPIPRDWYHTDWVADRTIAWLDGLAADDDWFCWMSFPDPHHPWDPPAVGAAAASTGATCRCPPATPSPRPSASASSTPSPATGASGTTATLVSNYEAPTHWVPATLTADQVREVNALQRRRVRADRRGPRPGARRRRGPGLGRRRRRRLHHRPRRAAGRLRPAVQGPVPRRRAHAAAAGVAPGAVGRRRPRPSVTAPGRPGRPGPHVLRASPAWRPGTGCRAAAARRRRRRRRPRLRAGAHRVGQRAVRRRACTCARSPATAGCAPPTGPAPSTTAPRASSTTSPTTRCSSVNRWDDPSARAVRDDLLSDLWDHQPPEHQPRLDLEAPV